MIYVQGPTAETTTRRGVTGSLGVSRNQRSVTESVTVVTAGTNGGITVVSRDVVTTLCDTGHCVWFWFILYSAVTTLVIVCGSGLYCTVL